MTARVDAIIDRIGTSRRDIIPLLQALQDEFSYLPSDALLRVYERTEIDRAQLISVSTFYSQFRHVPYGKHIIKVCTGTACHVKGANNVYDAFRRELKMEEDRITTADQEYSIEKIACLGCCALAPVVQIDEKIYGHVQPGRVNEVLDEFRIYNQEHEREEEGNATRQIVGEIRLGMENCCQASGTSEIYQAVIKASDELGIEVNIKPVSCVGACNQVPLIDVAHPDGSIERYPNVRSEEIKEILLHHFQPASRLRRLKNSILNHIDMFHTDTTWDNILWKSEQERTGAINTFLSGQKRVSTEGYGLMSPLDIDEYIARGGFEALKKAITSKSRQEIIDTILRSGLRGRGGGGFLTGRKWELVAASDQPEKYVICNGDEGDPGAFMDRILLESYPLRVIEGMIIAGYAVGAKEGIFYIRAEYPIAVKRLQIAIDQAREYGLLGKNIFDSGFDFDIDIRLGAGAFVCGEETALMTSIEGKRGEPRPRPPFPAVKGLFGVPTILNNVETWANIPRIILNGADWFASMGTERSKGTKVFCLVGKINNTGLVEIPMGTTLREIVEDIGGGIPNGKKFKAAQTGGPSGGCIPASLIDTPIDYDNLIAIGSMMGSGGLIVMDEDTCMVDIAKFFLEFTVDESCGKCTPCRVGTRRLLEMLEQITAGNGTVELLREMEELCYYIKANSLCALGQSAPNPVLSTLHYFRDEYEAHCIEKRCPAGVCKRLVRFVIEEDKCKGCTACARACPVNAISGEVRKPHQIDTRKCIKCGACMEKCKFGAIEKK